MEIRFYLVQVNGEKISDIKPYEDDIFNILANYTDEHDEASVGADWFSLSKLPTLNEILAIEKNLASLGLVINA